MGGGFHLQTVAAMPSPIPRIWNQVRRLHSPAPPAPEDPGLACAVEGGAGLGCRSGLQECDLRRGGRLPDLEALRPSRLDIPPAEVLASRVESGRVHPRPRPPAGDVHLRLAARGHRLGHQGSPDDARSRLLLLADVAFSDCSKCATIW